MQARHVKTVKIRESGQDRRLRYRETYIWGRDRLGRVSVF